MKIDMLQRRKFLGSLAASGLMHAVGSSPVTPFVQTGDSSPRFTDYKALVCVFLLGGNDSWNMVVPLSDAEYGAYFKSRGGGTSSSLAIPRENLLAVTRNDFLSKNRPYGFHPNLSGLHQLFTDGRLAIVPNVGPLTRPISKDQFLGMSSDSKDLPPQLFSHFDQVEQWASLRGRFLLRSGWGGRISDLFARNLGTQQIPINVSLYGQSLFQTPNDSDQYVMGQGGVEFPGGLGAQDDGERRRSIALSIFDQTLQSGGISFYERGYARVQQRAIGYAELIGRVLSGARETQAFSKFSDSSGLSAQLRTVAKLISQRNSLSMSRQIFYVGIGGFDTHDRHLEDHARLLTELSRALRVFHDATVELGVADQVTLFTQSDFGRTLTSNGDGSDHGWGGMQFVVGGAVKGGQFYGEYPSLAMDGPQTLPLGGAMLPTVSADQYAATIAKWFGVPQQSLPLVAPNLENFSQWDLGFMTA